MINNHTSSSTYSIATEHSYTMSQSSKIQNDTTPTLTQHIPSNSDKAGRRKKIRPQHLISISPEQIKYISDTKNKNNTPLSFDQTPNTKEILDNKINTIKNPPISLHSMLVSLIPSPNIYTTSPQQEKTPEKHKTVNKNICVTCNKIYSSKWTLARHNKIYTGKNKIQCDICKKKYASSYMKIHKKTNNRPARLTCDICQKTYVTLLGLNEHIKQHSNSDHFTCLLCKTRYSTQVYLNMHMKIHTNKDDLTCDICEITYSTLRYLKEHMKFHSNNPRLTCSIRGCKKIFQSRTTLIRHERSHVKQKKFKCSMCQRAFKLPNILKRHISIVHKK